MIARSVFAISIVLNLGYLIPDNGAAVGVKRSHDLVKNAILAETDLTVPHMASHKHIEKLQDYSAGMKSSMIYDKDIKVYPEGTSLQYEDLFQMNADRKALEVPRNHKELKFEGAKNFNVIIYMIFNLLQFQCYKITKYSLK